MSKRTSKSSATRAGKNASNRTREQANVVTSTESPRSSITTASKEPEKNVIPSPRSDVITANEEPVKKVSLLFQILYFLVGLSGNSILLPVVIFLIPFQANLLDPNHVALNVGLIESIGGVAILIAAPLAGAISDRSTSRFGRRRFWLMIHMVGAALSIALLASAPAIWVMALGWALVQFFGGALLTVLQAVTPDQVPTVQRGTVSAWFGLAIPFAAVIGGVVVNVSFKHTPLRSYYFFLVFLVIAVLIFVAILRDRRLTQAEVEPFDWQRFLARFWIDPRLHPDFAWALLTRLLLFLGYYAAASFILVYIDKGLNYSKLFPGQTTLQGTMVVQGVETICIVVSSFVAGIISDKIKRRKPIVIAAALLIAAGLFTPALSPTWNAMLVFSVLLGLGYGSYLAVDTALITLVLPKAEDRGRDLGIINLALAVPLIVSPLIGSALISSLGYSALFAVSGVLAALGGVLVLQIKSVR